MLILFVDFYIKTYLKKQTAVIKPRVLEERCKVRGTVENVPKVNNDIFEMSMRNRKEAWHSKDNARSWNTP